MTNHEKPPKTDSLERERKFVVDLTVLLERVELDKYPHEKIRQGYLLVSDLGAVRIRQMGDDYFETVKSAAKENPVERREIETHIPKSVFDDLWPATEGMRVEKTRYRVPVDGCVVEIDVFEGDNAGHVLAEFEADTLEAVEAFEPPTWFGPDVTADKAYGNASIAEYGWPAPTA